MVVTMGTASVGDRLREARLLAGISARHLDELSGTACGHAALIESGRRGNIEARIAVAFADTLGLSLDWLLKGEGDLPTESSVRDAVARAEERLVSSPFPSAAEAG